MKNILSPLSKRFDHPLFASLFIIAGICVVLGVGIDATGGNPFAAGFFGVYAILFTFFGVIAYGCTYFVKYVSQLRDEPTQRTDAA